MKVDLSPASHESYDHELKVLTEARAASRLAARDSQLWGDSCAATAENRLGWVELPKVEHPEIARAEELRRELAKSGVHRFVLSGMGGSSLGAAVIARALEVELTFLTSTAPAAVHRAFGDDLKHTGLIVSSKSGTTVETRSHLAAFEAACADAGFDPAERVIAITDPGSQLNDLERFTAVFTTPADVGGRYSALTAFGLVPAVLAGGDPRPLLEAAAQCAAVLGRDDDNPAVELAAFLSSAHARDVDKLVLADQTGVGLGAWIEQLVGESLGKDGRGLLPIAVADPNSDLIQKAGPDVSIVQLALNGEDSTELPAPVSGHMATVTAELGAALYLWEFTTALLAFSTAVDPFDQPDVESAKASARAALADPEAVHGMDLVFSYENIDVYGNEHALASVRSISGTVQALAGAVPEFGYVAVQAFVDPERFAAIEALREAVFRLTGLVTTFGFGPAYLHSTGQYHKGGRNNGAFIQITADPAGEDLAVPGADCSFAQLLSAQADGDADALRRAGRPVVRLHLRTDGWTQLERSLGLKG